MLPSSWRNLLEKSMQVIEMVCMCSLPITSVLLGYPAMQAEKGAERVFFARGQTTTATTLLNNFETGRQRRRVRLKPPGPRRWHWDACAKLDSCNWRARADAGRAYLSGCCAGSVRAKKTLQCGDPPRLVEASRASSLCA